MVMIAARAKAAGRPDGKVILRCARPHSQYAEGQPDTTGFGRRRQRRVNEVPFRTEHGICRISAQFAAIWILRLQQNNGCWNELAAFCSRPELLATSDKRLAGAKLLDCRYIDEFFAKNIAGLH